MTATELEFTSEVEVSLVDHSGSDLSIPYFGPSSKVIN